MGSEGGEEVSRAGLSRFASSRARESRAGRTGMCESVFRPSWLLALQASERKEEIGTEHRRSMAMSRCVSAVVCFI